MENEDYKNRKSSFGILHLNHHLILDIQCSIFKIINNDYQFKNYFLSLSETVIIPQATQCITCTKDLI